MSLICRAVARLYPMGVARNCLSSSRNFARSLVVLSGNPRKVDVIASRSNVCSCGCGIHGMHTRGDRELVEFLQEEIGAEKKTVTPVTSKLDDFDIKTDQAEIILTKKFHDEEITVTLNVNHTVDTDASEAELDPNADNPPTGDLKSRPTFEVDLKVGSRILSFTCSYTGTSDIIEGEDNPEDIFGINEVTLYEGEWSESTYCVSGDILDGMMYDLLMNMLEERGISSEFAEKLSTYCSEYEHLQYVGLLQKMQNFIKRN